ncbi:MAG: hypothetical protein U0K93_03925 [Acutalibacteraceae bacterium]|jgi:rod shape-determining protein MreD|nr:hypothetical protein [Acutalibacteraceae bacterium]
MLYKKNHPFIALLTFLLFFTVIILNTAGIFDLTIKNAVPFTPLPLLTAFCLFSDIKKSALAGFLTGACVDSVASGSYCFNTIILLITATLVCLTANNLFNKNIRAATVLSLLTAVFYFLFYWIFFHAFGMTVQQSLQYLLAYSLPSALYTSVFIFPFYIIFRYLNKLKAK